jgi:hypothetical protein
MPHIPNKNLTVAESRSLQSAAIRQAQGLIMKAFFVALGIAAATLSGSSSFAADERNVTVVNGTGYGIKFLGFNNPGDSDWSENELPPNSVLPDGNSVYVKFNTQDNGCKWNVRIDWADEGYPGVLWRDIDLCSIDSMTLRYDRATDKTSAELK